MVEPPHQIAFYGSPGKRRNGLIISALLAVVGVLALAAAGPSLPDGAMIGSLALAIAAVFLVHVLRSTSGSDPLMTIDGDGVWFRDWDLPKIPWRHVEAIHVAGIRLHMLIQIDLLNGEAFFASLDQANARRPSNPLIKPNRLTAPASAFDAHVGDVVEALREFNETAGSI